ncbi:LL-diaminopimelate aminotransferase [Bacillus solimangrovi]|uniref:Aminotransferase n=1 Tax=Bacillus solimangrovi TaxID=1305675 RepID=A0A1E5LFI3_9BACI|nr:LL-diaminopimelate aminotransferase [Bacillus solimangrovi]OEH92834.1 LL-diaminopimelate aminotransferase [Bacillus solimangrovi]
MFSKLAKSFPTSIFSELADYKAEKIAEGLDLIDLSIGSPDLPPPIWIRDEMAKWVQNENSYGYTLTGLNEFYQSAANYMKRKFSVELNPALEIVQLMGSQDGLVHLPMVLAEEGDVILVTDPGYTAYSAGVKMSGAEMVSMPLKKEHQFLPQFDEIPEKVAKRTKMMFLNFPGNPVPVLANRCFYEKAISFAKKYGIIIVHDLAYADLVFGEKSPISIFEFDGAKDVAVEFHSLSKNFNMAGCRIGYLVGNESIVEALKKLKSNLDYGVFAPIQHAAIKALREGDVFLNENCRLYEKRRDVLVSGLQKVGWNVELSEATMFVWAEIPEGFTSQSFAYQLIDKCGVVTTPGNAFGQYGEGFVRIALVQPENRLHEVVKRIGTSDLFS